jgi:superfamily II DNA or RNA helicase
MADGTHNDMQQVRERLLLVEGERNELLRQLDTLERQAFLDAPPVIGTPLGQPACVVIPATSDERVALFLKLFRCRGSVYPKMWENKKKGTKGYSPACDNEWRHGVCEKPRVKCSECRNQAFHPLDETAAREHLLGHVTIGTYAIRKDDTCVFLACDFDRTSWSDDVTAYRRAAMELGVDIAVERSRSGNGAHAWIFFSEAVPARLARVLGTILLSRALDHRHSLSVESFDRFFPSQDYLPTTRHGFGNLIALPLQKVPRDNGNSVFIDEHMQPHANQWIYLAKIRCLSLQELRSLIRRVLAATKASDHAMDQALETDRAIIEKEERAIKLPVPMELTVIRDEQIHIPLPGIPVGLVSRLKRLATFPNPKFYERQRMRLPTYPEQRFIFSGELREAELVLPRGLIDKATALLEKAGAGLSVEDRRMARKGLKVSFTGTLTAEQVAAVGSMKSKDIGIIVMPPGSGKTVLGCAMIAKRKAPTLILVHRQPLLGQWKARLQQFLALGDLEIGVITGTKQNPGGKIDVAMIQSLAKNPDLPSLAVRYAHIIVDECHRIPAPSFEGVLKTFKARYVLGLTATPYRKDGMERILLHQCGPSRYTSDAAAALFGKSVIVRETCFNVPSEQEEKPAYHILAELIANDEARNSVIAGDIVKAAVENRRILILADRTGQVLELQRRVGETLQRMSCPASLFKPDSQMGIKSRRTTQAAITAACQEPRGVCIFATGSLIGEGFDLPALDTLILASPISFKGRLVQYAGRLHRPSEGKADVRIHDYLDASSPVMLKMYRKRHKAYETMGYTVKEIASGSAGVQNELAQDW